MPDSYRRSTARAACQQYFVRSRFSVALRALLHLASLLGACCRDPQLRLPALSCCQNAFSSKTLCKACRKGIHSRIVVFFSNLHFQPCLKRVVLYPKWSLIFFPSCCLGKLLSAPHMPPSHTGHSFLFSCSQEGLDNPKPRSVCNGFLSPQIRSHCPFLLIIFFSPPFYKAEMFPIHLPFHSSPSPMFGLCRTTFQLRVHRIQLCLQSPSF